MKAIAICALMLVTTGCMSVRPVMDPGRFIPQQQPELVWVTSPEYGERAVPVSSPMIRGDSLHGQLAGLSEPVRLHLPQVRSVAARQPDRKRTTLLVAGAALAAGFIVWRAANGGGQSSGCVFDARSGWYCPQPPGMSLQRP